MIDYCKDKLDSIQDLPTLPAVCERLSSMISNPNASAQKVGVIIESDQSLTSKLLKLVNSAFFGLPQHVSTISHAIVLLGFKEISNLAFSTSVINTFGTSHHADAFDLQSFWKHSLACAITARCIGNEVGSVHVQDIEEAYVAGLIHDIGKLVLHQYMHDEFNSIYSLVSQENIRWIDAEQRILGYTHQDVGQYLAIKWQLPEVLVRAIKYHNMPETLPDSSHAIIVYIVHLADIMVKSIDLGFSGDHLVPDFYRSAWDQLGLKKSQISEILSTAEIALNDVFSI